MALMRNKISLCYDMGSVVYVYTFMILHFIERGCQQEVCMYVGCLFKEANQNGKVSFGFIYTGDI